MSEVTLSWLSILTILAGVGLTVLARWTWQFRERPGAKYWTGVQLGTAIWALSYGCGLLVFDPTLRPLFDIPLWFARAVTPPLILFFALAYTGRGKIIRSIWGLFVIIFYGIAFIIYMTNFRHQLVWVDYHIEPIFGAAAVNFTPQIGLFVFVFASYLIVGIAAIVLLEPVVSYRQLFGIQATTLIVALSFPAIVNLIWLFRLGPSAHLDFTPQTYFFTYLIMTHLFYAGDMFEFMPATTHIADNVAIDDIESAIITLSPTNKIIDFNDTAGVLLELDRDKAVGRRIKDVAGFDATVKKTSHITDTIGNPSQVFDVTISQISSPGNEHVGYLVVFYEITEVQQRQQRLAMQNRILRHNLRNSLGVVRGRAEQLEETSSKEEISSVVETIKRTSDDLLQLSEKVRTFDAALSQDSQLINVSQVCTEVVNDLAERYPDANIHLDNSQDIEIQGSWQLLYTVIKEAIENGIVHTDDGMAEVTVVIHPEEVSDQVIISIEDTGPGIPEHELEALERGDEGPLSHSSSVGLWIINLGSTAIGGSASFETDSTNGTTVSIQLPN